MAQDAILEKKNHPFVFAQNSPYSCLYAKLHFKLLASNLIGPGIFLSLCLKIHCTLKAIQGFGMK